VDERKVSAVNSRISRVASAMTMHDVCQVLLAWGKLAASGLKITSMLGEADMDAMFARVGELEHQMSPSQKHMIDEAFDFIRTRGRYRRRRARQPRQTTQGSTIGQHHRTARRHPLPRISRTMRQLRAHRIMSAIHTCLICCRPKSALRWRRPRQRQ